MPFAAPHGSCDSAAAVATSGGGGADGGWRGRLASINLPGEEAQEAEERLAVEEAEACWN